VAVAGNEDFVVRADQAGTATRPLRVQTGHAHLVEPVDDTPDRVLITLDQTGDGRDGIPLAEAMITIARRSRIDDPVPRRTMFCNR
jgi:hypothetical protein